MKRLLIVLSILVLLIGCLSAQDMKAPTKSKIAIQPDPGTMKLSDRNAPEYSFHTLPLTILTSYWDYMIGGYNHLPVRVQTPAAGGGVYLTYTGQRATTTLGGVRRVFYTYILADGTVSVNNELTDDNVREGYTSVDIDQPSGKPIFAWHTNFDNSDPTILEVALAWDAFLEQTPGLISEPVMIINNPSTLETNGTTDNEFLWPNVHIGPSPLDGHRRVYVSTTNSKSHTVSGASGPLPSENQLIAYADFTPEMLENGETLTWTYTSIPLLDAWNSDLTAFRRPQMANFVSDDGKYYIVGRHIAEEADAATPIDEPYVDVFVNSNYGEGEWIQYSMNPDRIIDNPVDPTGAGYYTADDGSPLPYLTYQISMNGHMNPTMDNWDIIHFPVVGYMVPDSTHWYPATSFLKDITFNTLTNTFLISDLYPKDTNPNDGSPAIPWNLDGLGAQFVLNDDGSYGLLTEPSIPYVYWDTAALENAMTFHYSSFHMSKMNDHDQMVLTWQNTTRSYLYNTYPADYDSLSPFQQVPEIFISVYPTNVPGHPELGLVWSDPISINSVDTPELTVAGDPMIPEWVYPGDYVEFLGTDADNNRLGRVHLMFYDDNSWGAASIDPAVGIPNGGKVMYTSIDIKFPPFVAVGNDDNVATSTTMLKQNYPNPFNPSTSISFNMPNAGKASLMIYNIKGQLVKTLVDGPTASGNHTVVWNGKNDNDDSVGSGIYFYSFKSGNTTETKKMMLVK